jgi:hypothetical protein
MKRINASLLIGVLSRHLWMGPEKKPVPMVYGTDSLGYVFGMTDTDVCDINVMLIDQNTWDFIAAEGVESLQDALWIFSNNWILIDRNPIEP